MKTTQLPPVRAVPSSHEQIDQIESVQLDGETPSQVLKKGAIDAVRRRRASQDFVEHGRLSLARARETVELYPLVDVLGAVKSRLDTARAAIEWIELHGSACNEQPGLT
jgi:hypothetical protein